MTSAGLGHGGAGSSRSANGYKVSSSSIDWLGREMLEVKLGDRAETDSDRDSEPDLIDGVGAETGHVIRTTIGGRNGQPKQVVSYIAEHVVGTGSFGVVFQAKCRETGEIVAIKKVLQDKRYKNRELQIMQMLDHPNIVALKHSFFSTSEKEEVYLNLVLEYVPETVNRIARQYNKMNQRVPSGPSVKVCALCYSTEPHFFWGPKFRRTSWSSMRSWRARRRSISPWKSSAAANCSTKFPRAS